MSDDDPISGRALVFLLASYGLGMCLVGYVLGAIWPWAFWSL